MSCRGANRTIIPPKVMYAITPNNKPTQRPKIDTAETRLIRRRKRPMI